MNINVCKVWATTQAKKKVMESLTQDQQKRFSGFVQGEPTTAEVPSFDHDSSIAESAKTLARYGPTVVLVDETEKSNIHKEPRIIAVTPSEFNGIHDKTNEVYEKLPIERDFLDLLLLSLFNPDIFAGQLPR